MQQRHGGPIHAWSPLVEAAERQAQRRRELWQAELEEKAARSRGTHVTPSPGTAQWQREQPPRQQSSKGIGSASGLNGRPTFSPKPTPSRGATAPAHSSPPSSSPPCRTSATTATATSPRNGKSLDATLATRTCHARSATASPPHGPLAPSPEAKLKGHTSHRPTTSMWRWMLGARAASPAQPPPVERGPSPRGGRQQGAPATPRRGRL